VDFHIAVLHSLLKRRLLVAFTQSPIKPKTTTIACKNVRLNWMSKPLAWLCQRKTHSRYWPIANEGTRKAKKIAASPKKMAMSTTNAIALRLD